MRAVLETIGRADQSAYGPSDWQERDNFVTIEQARAYAKYKSRMYPATPYRIVAARRRFYVEFVPEWLLR